MKNKLYLLNVAQLKDKETYDKVFSLLSNDRISKLNKLRNDSDRYLCIGAEILLKIALYEELNIPLNEELIYGYGEYDKPYLKNIDIKYNISHSGEYVICILSNKEVGCDIEVIKEANLDVAKRFFSTDEYKQIINSSNANDEFYRLWVIKESYLKYKGTGIKDINNIDTTGLFIKEYNIDGYKCAVCLDSDIDLELSDTTINHYLYKI